MLFMGEKCGASVNFWHHQMESLVLFGQSKSEIKVYLHLSEP